MKKRLFPHHGRGERQQLVLFVIFFSFFIFVSFFYLLQNYNIISGAGTTGTVNFTILESEKPPAILGNKIIKDKSKILSFLFEVIPKKLKLHINQYDYGLLRVRAINRADFPFDLTLSTNVRVLKILEERVPLDPGQEKELLFQVATDKVGIYIGVLTFEDTFVFKQLPVLIQVDHVDFRVTVDLASTATVLPGQAIAAHITVDPLFTDNVTLAYSIQDVNGKIYWSEEEQATASGDSLRFQKTFALPADLPYQDYFLIATAEQLGKKASGGDSFTLAESLSPTQEFPTQIYYQSPLLFFLIVLAILLLHLIIIWRRKK